MRQHFFLNFHQCFISIDMTSHPLFSYLHILWRVSLISVHHQHISPPPYKMFWKQKAADKLGPKRVCFCYLLFIALTCCFKFIIIIWEFNFTSIKWSCQYMYKTIFSMFHHLISCSLMNWLIWVPQYTRMINEGNSDFL